MRLLIYSLKQENQLAKKQAASAFMLEEGKTLIEGEFKPEEKFNTVNITGGKQTQVYHKFRLSDFAYINGEPNRVAAIKKYMTIIRAYPDAYILLWWL